MAAKDLGGVPTLKYLDLSGFGSLMSRGGAVRNLFLRNGIDFKEELVTFPDWNGGAKQAVIDSGENPSGVLPIVFLNGKSYTEHHAILRTLSRRLGEYGTDVENDFLIDRASDSTSFFRDQLVLSLLQPAAKEGYLNKRPDFYKALNALLIMSGAEGAFVVGSKPSFADDLWFALLNDDTLKYGDEELNKNEKLKAFFDAYSAAYPAIKAWRDGGYKGNSA